MKDGVGKPPNRGGDRENQPMPTLVSDHWEYVTVGGERYFLAPKEPRNLPQDVYDAAIKLQGVEPVTNPGPVEEPPDESWTVAELRDYAEENEIDLSGLRLKAEILEAVTGV